MDVGRHRTGTYLIGNIVVVPSKLRNPNSVAVLPRRSSDDGENVELFRLG